MSTILGIDASNIRYGGGVTHISELLRVADPRAHGFNQVIVWGGTQIQAMIEPRDWLCKVQDPMLDRSLPYRVFWQRYRLARLAKAAACDLLLVPGGSNTSGFRPLVAMNQNLLPFEWREIRRYGLSRAALRLLLLRLIQTRTFNKADGVIYVSRYARSTVARVSKRQRGQTAVIPHGVNPRFYCPPRPQRHLRQLSAARPLRALYVSVVDVYKQQWRVAEAVAKLRSEGFPIALELVGP